MRPSRVPEANEHFQRAMLVAMSSLDLPRMQESYERALAADPKFAEARAEYAFSFALQIITGWSSDVSLMYRAEEEVRRALSDDPECGRAHSAIAGVYFMQGRKELVPAEVERALALNPNDLAGYGWVVSYYRMLGDYARAEGQAALALTLNPLFFPVRVFYAEVLLEKGDTTGALREGVTLIDQAPENPSIVYAVAYNYVVAGEVAKAREILDRLPQRFERNFMIRLSQALVLAAEGKGKEAEAVLDAETQKYAETNLRSIIRMPEIYSLLDRRAEALDWLDRSIRMGDERAEWFERDPLLANVREEPRFAQLVESVRYRRAQRQQGEATALPSPASR
jgi:tetratricopeptide (TPR) repeat protein